METSLLIDKIDSLRRSVDIGFAQIDKRLDRLELNHDQVSSKTSAHEERFVHMSKLIEKTISDLDSYSKIRRETDVDQYEKINGLRSQIEQNKTESNEKTGDLFFKWLPLLGGLAAIGISIVSFIKGSH